MAKKAEEKKEPPKEEKKEPPKHDQTCVYTGRRLTWDNKVWQRFETPDGKERFFTGIKRVWIGHTYRCSESSILIKPERVDVPWVDNPAWSAEDALVDAHNAKKREEKKLRDRATPALKNAIAALAPLCKGLSQYKREALISHLAYEAAKKGKKK